MGSADGTSIHTNRLVGTWKVEMKRKDIIKEEGGSKTEGLKNQERNTVAIQNQTCNPTKEH